VPSTRQVPGHGVAHHAQAQEGDALGGSGFVGACAHTAMLPRMTGVGL
jgi:hypothetical protein